MTTPTHAAAAAHTRAPNPLLCEPSGAFGAVPFDALRLEHFPPAFDQALAAQRAAVRAIVACDDPPTLANTLEAFERSGCALERVRSVFNVFTHSLADEEVRRVETEHSAKLAAHESALLLDQRLFARIAVVRANADALGLDAEARRLAEVTHDRFVRAGAELDADGRARIAALNQREAELKTRFAQNLQRETDEYLLVLAEEDLDGLPPTARASAAETARRAGRSGAFAFTLQRPSVEQFLTHSSRRDLRRRLFEAFNARGANGDAHDNRGLITELVALRAERAALLGHADHASFITADSMARTPAAAQDLLQRVWSPALEQARAERERLKALMLQDGAGDDLAGWDWRYYAERLRRSELDLDPSELQAYLPLNGLRAAAFHVAERLFGLTFSERDDVPTHHPDVRVFEVKDARGAHAGLFYCDDFARPGKNSGAWMSSLRSQSALDGPVTAHVTNNLNITKPPPGSPVTLSPTEARTLFHELGHALHGLLSDVRYESLSGTSVSRDYVEFMSQFMEHYLTEPEVLEAFARHVESGAPMPVELRERFIAASRFNQGFATCEFVASALVDQLFHGLQGEAARDVDPLAFEASALARLGALPEIPMRHRSAHFAHVFAGGYSAAYYSYLWSEVLDSDAFEAFNEAGDIFDPETARRLKAHVYSRGNTLEALDGYAAFRGRAPAVEPLLRNRGLIG